MNLLFPFRWGTTVIVSVEPFWAEDSSIITPWVEAAISSGAWAEESATENVWVEI